MREALKAVCQGELTPMADNQMIETAEMGKRLAALEASLGENPKAAGRGGAPAE